MDVENIIMDWIAIKVNNVGERRFTALRKFVVTPKEDDKSLTMTVRINKALLEEYDDLAVKTNRSRNELICMALQYALDNMELKER